MLLYKVNLTVFFCIFPIICYCLTDFVHLLGYGLLADTLSVYSTSDVTTCLEKCDNTTSCLAVQMLWGAGKCNLLTMVRAYTYEAPQCAFYLKNGTTVTIINRTLEGMDQLLQNVVYASQEVCPNGWTSESLSCKLDRTQSTCNEHATFLDAHWNNTQCVIPKMNITWTCPEDRYAFALGHFDYGDFCYIARPTGSAGTGNMYERKKNYCFKETGGYLASIHSEAENQVIQSKRFIYASGYTNICLGMIFRDGFTLEIGLSPKNYTAFSFNTNRTINDLTWLDGTALTYTNVNPASSLKTFTGTKMVYDGTWYCNLTIDNTGFNQFVCKQNAVKLYTPMNTIT
uniref:CW domain-containing protein n=1 Tax=Panagrellus redivivus TaxID=6233 RepID=A0A7E4V0P4_PANRE